MRSLIQSPAQSRDSYELRPSHTKLFPVWSWNPAHMGETGWPHYFTAWVSSAGKTSPTGISQLLPSDTCCPVMHHAAEPGSLFSMTSFVGRRGCWQGPLKPPLLQAEQAQIPLPFLTVEALQLLPILVASAEDTPEEWGYNLTTQPRCCWLFAARVTAGSRSACCSPALWAFATDQTQPGSPSLTYNQKFSISRCMILLLSFLNYVRLPLNHYPSF